MRSVLMLSDEYVSKENAKNDTLNDQSALGFGTNQNKGLSICLEVETWVTVEKGTQSRKIKLESIAG